MELQQTITSLEFSRWMEFYELEPWSESLRRAAPKEVRHARILSAFTSRIELAERKKHL